MKMIGFPEANKAIKIKRIYPAEPEPEENSYYSDEENTVFCWKLSWQERFKVLRTGKIWQHIKKYSEGQQIDMFADKPGYS